MGATRCVPDKLPSRHDPLAVRHADRTVDSRVVGVQHERDKHHGLVARGLSRDHFLNSETGPADGERRPTST